MHELTIVIPVYQTEQTLERCVESILGQSFTHFDLILVDDGSTDHCPYICDRLSQKDARIKVIHQRNGGLSHARNTGIKQACGEYITFVDSDDELAPNTLSPLMEDLKKNPHIDILEYSVLERKGHPKKERLLTFPQKEYQDNIAYWLEGKAFLHTYACNKIYRRSIFHGVRYPIGKTFEDVYILPRILGIIPHGQTRGEISCHTNIPRVKTTNMGLYIYHWNKSGITAKAQSKELRDLYYAHEETLHYLMKKDETKNYPKHLQFFMATMLNILLDLYELTSTYEDCSLLMKCLKDASHVKAYKLKLLSLIGYKKLCKLNKTIHLFVRK